jgi:hypothetical protein
MTIETYHLVLNGLALAASLAALLQPWVKQKARLLLTVVVVVTFLSVIGGQLLAGAARERQITRALGQLSTQLGPWGRPFDDLHRQMNAFDVDVLSEALRRAEDAGEVQRVTREVRDPSNARGYLIDVFVSGK